MSRRARQRAQARPWERGELDDGLMQALEEIGREQQNCGQDAREERREREEAEAD